MSRENGGGYSPASDLIGYLFWTAAFVGFTFPLWGPVAAFLIGAVFGLSL